MAGLPWIRCDTNVNTHDKILELVGLGAKGKSAGFVYWMALTYSGAHDTGGLIKKAVLPFVHGTPADARALVDARLWAIVEGGWQIVNYGTRNVVGASQQAVADAIRAAQIEGGKKGAHERWDR
ncbi:hypothetical protein ACSBPH_01725 [Microbacterium sp. F51-2R]|jgi:hypothetical protein|uniref:hypothetical protein n=1 Tax=Microbacterium sp. F51-2R TaxID=3445777 RepID=UPI003FA08264